MHKLIVQEFGKAGMIWYKLAKKEDINGGNELTRELVKFIKNLKGQEFIGGSKPMYADFMVNLILYYNFISISNN